MGKSTEIPLKERFKTYLTRLGRLFFPDRSTNMNPVLYKKASSDARDKMELSKLISSKEKLACRLEVLKDSGIFPDLTIARLKRSVDDLNRRIDLRMKEIVTAARQQVRKEATAVSRPS